MPVIYRAVIEKPLLMFLSAIVDVRKKNEYAKIQKMDVHVCANTWSIQTGGYAC